MLISGLFLLQTYSLLFRNTLFEHSANMLIQSELCWNHFHTVSALYAGLGALAAICREFQCVDLVCPLCSVLLLFSYVGMY